MNVFNRIVMVLLALAVSIVFIITAIIPEHIVFFGQLLFDNMVITPVDRIVLIIGAAFVTILALVLINAELRGERRKGVVLAQVAGARAELTTDSIGQRVRQEVELLSEVAQAVPSVASRGGSVDIQLVLLTTAGHEVPNKVSEVVQTVRKVVEQGMGVKVGKLNVIIKYQPQPVPSAQKA
ncbi:MAG: hypothetical protein HY675_23845 [Chloroflexi bacterium]|nr:hypothetical protein [Chloroflexota bacterium]